MSVGLEVVKGAVGKYVGSNVSVGANVSVGMIVSSGQVLQVSGHSSAASCFGQRFSGSSPTQSQSFPSLPLYK